MRSARGNGTLASSSGMISLAVSLGLAPSSMRTPRRHQHRNFELHLVADALVGLGEDDHVDRAGHVFERALSVEIAPLRLQHAHVGDDAGSDDVLVFAGGFRHRGDLFDAERPQVLQLVFVFLQRMPGDEESENFFFGREPRVLIPVGNVGQLVVRAPRPLPAETRQTGRAGPIRRRAALSAPAPSPCRGRPSTARGGPANPWRRS